MGLFGEAKTLRRGEHEAARSRSSASSSSKDGVSGTSSTRQPRESAMWRYIEKVGVGTSSVAPSPPHAASSSRIRSSEPLPSRIPSGVQPQRSASTRRSAVAAGSG